MAETTYDPYAVNAIMHMTDHGRDDGPDGVMFGPGVELKPTPPTTDQLYSRFGVEPDDDFSSSDACDDHPAEPRRVPSAARPEVDEDRHMLDARIRAVADTHSESYAQALDRVLNEPDDDAVAAFEAPEPADEPYSDRDELDARVRDHAREHGVSYGEALTMVLDEDARGF
jgi:hypothetical protein